MWVRQGLFLVYDGLVNVTASLEEIPSDIADGRAPRTAVGIKKDGTILVVVADGRSSRSAGMTFLNWHVTDPAWRGSA